MIFRQLGAGNRAEVVRLAVLQPVGTNVPATAREGRDKPSA